MSLLNSRGAGEADGVAGEDGVASPARHAGQV